MIIKYNICLIKRGASILLLNREKASWMGCWNGVGGKLKPEETPEAAMLRELEEETGIRAIDLVSLQFKGFLTWTVDGGQFGGSYMYLGELADDFELITPKKTEEGILDWKTVEWIMNKDNQGVATNIPKCLDFMLTDPSCYEHLSCYVNGILEEQQEFKLDPSTEHCAKLRMEYFSKYETVPLQS